MPIPEPLKPDQLYTVCDPADLALTATDRSVEVSDSLGQDRALEAIRFGVGIKRDGFNIFAYGPSGTGKHMLVRRQLEAAAAEMPTPSDWCYVNNFCSFRPAAAVPCAPTWTG